MASSKFRPRRSTYQICITILEAKHLPHNVNPVIVVKVGNRKRKTVVRERTDSPVYNEYFVFDMTCDLDQLLSTKIMIAVYMRTFMRRLKFLGSTVLEVALVWDQPDHQYYRKWAMVTNPKNLAAGPKGYVKCSIAINAKGEKVKTYVEPEDEDDIEGNLLLPLGGESLPFRQRARYIFTIYRADGLPDISTLCSRSDFQNINPYVQISFAGLKETTSKAWQTYSPHFNMKIIFKEMFPSLSQRARITIKHDGCQSCVVATYILHTNKISNSGEYGFLPTFGPSFLHFYDSNDVGKNICFGKYLTPLPFYRGRVLLSLKTEMDDPEASSDISVETEPTAPIIEQSLWETEEYYLVGVLYDACMIDRRRFMGKSISFELSLGNAGNNQFPHSQCHENKNTTTPHKLEFESETVPRMTGTLDGKYNYLPLGSRKPCLYVKSWWPNLEWRMHNSNNLSFIADFLVEKLEKLEALVAVENLETYKIYNETIRTLQDYCIHYLHILGTGRYDDEGGTTKLDRHRVNLCRKEIQNVLKRIKINGELPNNHCIKIAMVHAYQYLKKLKELCQDPQHSLPNIFIWMTASGKRIAFSRLSAEKIIYSEEAAEKGKKCGRRVNVFVKKPQGKSDIYDKIACKIELFLWLGNAKYIGACWAAIPPGYEVDHEKNVDSFPKYLEYTHSSTFQLRAHIFQGRFDLGMDASGLLDLLVYVTFHGYTAATRIMRQTLDPFWDQTLMLRPVIIHGTKENIKEQPPKVVLQFFDQDIGGSKEFCGRCTAVPLVKLMEETYSPPDFPPKLKWYKFKSQRDCSGSILAAFELIETEGDEAGDTPIKIKNKEKIYSIPVDIRPKMASYRLEVIFWGIRDMKKINYMPVQKPRIIIECAGVHVKSEVMENAKKHSNFEEIYVSVDLEMPELDIYYPSVTIKAYDSRGFGFFKYAGICIIPSVYVFLERLITEDEYNSQMDSAKSIRKSYFTNKGSAIDCPLLIDNDQLSNETEKLIAYKKLSRKDFFSKLKKILRTVKKTLKKVLPGKGRKDIYPEARDETLDWWSKYFASLEEERNRQLGILRHGGTSGVTFKVYDSELEMQPEFEGFQDRLRTFELWKGKKSGDPDYDSNNYAGKFKGRICIYRWPHPDKLSCKTRSGRNAANGMCNDYRSRELVRVLVRLYVVKGVNLQPNDPLSGKSDPYLCARLGKNYINDRKNFIPNQLNPTFGRLFEIEATFPQDYLLSIQVWDYDATTRDDLIGETKIDLENRFYSSHRASCGLSKIYNVTGHNAWRDRERPSQILEILCKRNNLPSPEYDYNYVRIGRKKFPFFFVDPEGEFDKEECMALHVLHQWQDFPICGCALVPEHIERRPLFNVKRPGLEQGKLELWIDMFQLGQLPPKPAIDITPPAPEEYEIRVIVWNTEDVPLIESQFLTGEKSSDIYVKGWILPDDIQKTDVHYSSLNGEGNFNWRFIFRVQYSANERVMIVRRKISVFARNETEDKLPCRLQLQVWDSDHFSKDDFLGTLTLDLAKMPRGSSNSKRCTLKLLNPSLPTMNLFKTARIKAWWPFIRSTSVGEYVQAGKAELEISILREAEANEQPVGKARDPPESLPPPNRPETSFSWFRNPWKACRFVVFRYYRWRIICCLVCVLFVLLAACGIYAFPGYMVKRLLGA